MNKIYIKKRINKETKKAADEEISNNTIRPRQPTPPKRKRKRKQQRTSTQECDTDEYTITMSKTNLTCSNFNNNTSADDEFVNDIGDDTGYRPIRSNPGISREDKKLYYYLEMIRRQESAEQRKIQKEAKRKNGNKAEKKILKIEQEPESEGPIQMSLIQDYDVDLEVLARYMHDSLQLSKNNGLEKKPFLIINKGEKEDNVS